MRTGLKIRDERQTIGLHSFIVFYRHAREGGHPEIYEAVMLAALGPRLRGGEDTLYFRSVGLFTAGGK
jgi:hypothetical protein